MTIIIPTIAVFIISFLLLSVWIYKNEKEEIKKKKGKIFAVMATAFILALAPTAVIGLVLFALFGSTNLVNTIFSLDISTSTLMLLTVSLVIYLYTIDSLLSLLVEHIMGRVNIFNHLILLLIRILAFYTIGLIFDLNQKSNVILAVIVAFIILLFEAFNNKKEEGNTNG
ncbi:hypothetical protein GWK91_12685 [Virgibacillus sp. MSP4-1]|uniref:hypothetical protein n=1 Tax=Virgibacillus sp. MSP4-1 TaxID=2700081 RepID=UPI00039A6B9E|nr:hypothetical protein [Virgibacillus sp. MSP4-1]QHS23752.1 hypothetical protein GWK91_12685 [Virgibacillus sp. MSP4-1]